MLISVDGQIQEIIDMHSELISTGVMKIFSESNFRAAIFDISAMSVYLFDKNRRIIATEEIKKKSAIAAMDICTTWVYNGKFNENDFAA